MNGIVNPLKTVRAKYRWPTKCRGRRKWFTVKDLWDRKDPAQRRQMKLARMWVRLHFGPVI